VNLRTFAHKHKQKFRQMNPTVQCTVYTETTWSDLRNQTRSAYQIASIFYREYMQSHQLRTMTLRGHINSVECMHAVTRVTPTPHHKCSQFVDSVKSLSFSLTRGFFGPIAYIHGTDLVWPRAFMIRRWCDLVKWPYGVQKSASSDFDQSKWLYKLLSGSQKLFC
jgi:hypothetical protein